MVSCLRVPACLVCAGADVVAEGCDCAALRPNGDYLSAVSINR